MKRRVFFMGVAGAAAGCMRSGKRRLNVYNWSEYIGSRTLADFQREFGVEIRYGTYEVAEELLAKVMTGNSGWDVVFPSNSFVVPMRDLGLLAGLDHRRLPHLGNLERRFQAPPWDPALTWSIPYMHGATGIAYANSAGAPERWADLWSTQFRGRMTMLDDPAEVFGACLKRMGCSLNSVAPTELRRAKLLAIAQKPLLRAYLNAEVRDQLAAGDVLAAQAWSITAQQAIEQSSQVGFAYPREGFPLYCDTAVILRESRRQELAHVFLDYLLRGDVAASIATEMRTATANAAAQKLLSPADAKNPTLYPPPEVLDRGEWLREVPAAAQRLRDRFWTEIKSA